MGRRKARESEMSFHKSKTCAMPYPNLLPFHLPPCAPLVNTREMTGDESVLAHFCGTLRFWRELECTASFSIFTLKPLVPINFRACLCGLGYPRQPSFPRQLYRAFMWELRDTKVTLLNYAYILRRIFKNSYHLPFFLSISFFGSIVVFLHGAVMWSLKEGSFWIESFRWLRWEFWREKP